MDDLKLKKVCPLPWLHLSSHLDSTMRICCNTDGPGFVSDDNGQTIKFRSVDNLNDYFNLNFFKDIRSKMLAGEEPEICKKCFEVEHHGGQSVRQGYMSLYGNNEEFLESLETTSPGGEISPTIQSLDFSLSNKCNLKCIMCSPSASYIIKRDYEELSLEFDSNFTEGAHKNWKGLSNIERIVEQVSPTLRDILTTGGEPFLNPEHLQILELLKKSGHSQKINLSYHTNCTVKNDRLFELWHSFKSVNVHFSIDAFGPLNEYIRFQTEWDDVVENVRIISSHPKTYCEVHSTIQALNIFNLSDLYEWISKLEGVSPLPFHIWMDQPNWLRLDILPPELLSIALKKLDQHFAKKVSLTQETKVREQQIRSYIIRAMDNFQGDRSLAEFKRIIRQFEGLRKTPSIETLVPELSVLFKS